MKLYVSMGQVHRHEINGKVIDKDSIAVINCTDYADGRRIAFELFGDKFCFTYSEEQLSEKCMCHFPRGKIEVN